MNRLLIISPFPPNGAVHGSEHSALASFAKNKVVAFQKLSPQTEITVLADIIPEEKTSWQKKNLRVKRVWKRNSFGAYLFLIKEVLKETKTKKVLIEFEWALFGKNPLFLAPFPFFILLLRILKKEVFTVSHGVLLDFSLLSPQLGLEQEGLKTALYNLGLNLFYRLLVTFSSQVVVLEEHFAQTLNRKFKTKKVVCLPHGVDTKIKQISRREARNKLKIKPSQFVLLSFGFLSWYKGSDLLAETFSQLIKDKPKTDFSLIFAGGQTRAFQEDSTYQKFIRKIKELADKTEEITITGFVPEKKIPLYFSAADLVIFPHRVFVSSSGPLSLSFFFQKPILLSQNLASYFKTEDLRESLEKAGLKKEDILFELDKETLAKKLTWAQKKENLAKLTRFSTLMKEKRDWLKIGQEYLKIMDLSPVEN